MQLHGLSNNSISGMSIFPEMEIESDMPASINEKYIYWRHSSTRIK